MVRSSGATIDDLLDMAQVRALTGYARSTVYDLMKKCRFPRPCSPPRARVKWRKADIDAYIAKLHEPPPEPEQVRMARINALAYAPRRGEKRRGRPPAAPPSGAAPQLATWHHRLIGSTSRRCVGGSALIKMMTPSP
jgi:predicted DNA-binding transcriptional regulator AlpA